MNKKPLTKARLLARRKLNSDGCWNWTGAIKGGGYGALELLGRQWGVHVLSAELWLGIPRGSVPVIRHTCDNPRCFNPNHLLPGSYTDNMQDSLERKRRPTGEKIRWSKLTDKAVLAARSLWRQGHTVQGLADQYGVCWNVMKRALSGEKWKSVK